MKNTTENISGSTFNGFSSNNEIIAWCSIYAFESVLIVAGNFPTIALFVVNRGLRKKSLFLVINMAVADLMYGAVLMPLKVYLMSVGNYYQLWMERQSSALNILYNILFNFFLQGSLMSAALISCERFYAISWPLKHRILSMRAYPILIAMTWTLTFLVSLVCTVLFYFTSSKVALTVVQSCFFTLLSIVCGCNIGIWRTFRRRRVASEQPITNCLQNLRLTKTLLLVSIIALVSWLPILIVSNLVIFYEMSVSWRIYHVAVALNASNSLLNPVIYALRIPEFRRALSLLCFTRQSLTTRTEDHKRRDNKVSSISSTNQLKAFGTDSTNLKLAAGVEDTI